MPAPYRRLGRIMKVHGTQGEVSVALRDGISSSRLGGTEVWIVPPPASGAIARRISSVKETPKGAHVHVEGIDSPGDAHEIVGHYLLARGEEPLFEAEEGEPLIGYEVLDETRGSIGSVDDVIHTGANDVLVLEGGPYGQVLVPVIPQVVLRTDDASRTVRVRLLEGLIEEDEA